MLNAGSVKRLVTIATAAVLAGLAVRVGSTPREYGFEPQNRPAADCPQEPCRATGKMTGFQVQQLKQRDGDSVTEFPTKVRKRNSWLVAFSLKLGDPTDRQKKFFNRLWGKPAQARISILDPEPKQGDRGTGGSATASTARAACSTCGRSSERRRGSCCRSGYTSPRARSSR